MKDIIISKLKEIKTSLNANTAFQTFHSLIERVGAIIAKKYGEENIYIIKLSKLKSDVYFALAPVDIERFKSLIDIIIDDLELSEIEDEKIALNLKQINKGVNDIKLANNKVFIVHGHNDGMKQSVARMIEKLNLETIILHEKSNQGQTVIEKFLNHSDVGFAIVLLSSDDLGYSIKDGVESIKKRARQNVIFELGFFTAKLGRNKVIALVEDASDFEIPSDINGVVYIKYDGDSGKWKFEVAKELKGSGYQLNLDKII